MGRAKLPRWAGHRGLGTSGLEGVRETREEVNRVNPNALHVRLGPALAQGLIRTHGFVFPDLQSNLVAPWAEWPLIPQPSWPRTL